MKPWRMKPEARLYLLAAVLLASAITGTIAWEIVNPITTLHRGLLFGVTWGLLPVAAIFMLDVFVAPNAWCGHLCPVGAFYGLLNDRALRVSPRPAETPATTAWIAMRSAPRCMSFHPP